MESADNRQPSPPVNQSAESDNAPSLSKTETIKLLNESIDRLESTIKAIGKNSVEELPSSDSINSLLNTTQELADSVVTTPPPQVVEAIAPEVETTPEVKTVPTPQAQPIAVEKITTEAAPPKTTEKPDRNPEPKNSNISKKQENKGLRIIGAIAIAIAIVAIIWLFFPQIKATVSSISQSESISQNIDYPSQPPTIDTPTIEPENSTTEVSPSPPDSVTLDPESDIPVETIETSIPQDLKAPGRATNLKIETIEPELTFTPEQTLVASLQAKFAELASSYDSDLFKKAKVDFPDNALIVEITDDWYSLNESRQTKLANDILKRSRQLNFDKLELEDANGTLVARNPVVGDRIIILQSNKTLSK